MRRKAIEQAHDVIQRMWRGQLCLDEASEDILFGRVVPILVGRFESHDSVAIGGALDVVSCMPDSVHAYMKRNNLASLPIDVDQVIRGIKKTKSFRAIKILKYIEPVPNKAIKMADWMLKNDTELGSAIELLLEGGDSGHDVLFREFVHGSGEKNFLIAEYMGEVLIPDSLAMKIMGTLGRSKSPDARWFATRAVRKSVNDKSTFLKILTDRLSDSDPSVAANAARAFGSGGPRVSFVLPKLHKLLETDARNGAAEAICHIGPKAYMTKALAKSLSSKDASTVRYCLCSLEKLGALAKEALPSIRALSKRTPSLTSAEKEVVAKTIRAIAGK